MKDRYVKEGDGKIIRKLKATFKRTAEDELSDTYGIFAIVTENYVVSGRQYVRDDGLVSAHKRAIAAALNRDKDFVLYVQKSNYYYQFDPKDLIDNATENKRNGIKMLNFDIERGEIIHP